MQFRRSGYNRHHSEVEGQKRSEMMVLYCLNYGIKEGQPGMMVSEISTRLHVTSPTVTQSINGLEANGMINRNVDPEDRRIVRVTLTDKGRAAIEAGQASARASFNGLVEFMGEEKSLQLVDLMSQVFMYFSSQEFQRNANGSETQSKSSGDDQG